MPDNDDNQETPLVKQLRETIKTLEGRNGGLTKENNSLKGTNILYAANLGHLSEKQRLAVLTMHGEGEMTAEALAATAAELGYEPQTAPPATTTPLPNGETNGDGTTPPSTPPATNGDVNHVLQEALAAFGADPEMDPMEALGIIQRIQGATRASQQNVAPTFTDRMKEAKSKDELLSLISTQGPANGIILEEDTY